MVLVKTSSDDFKKTLTTVAKNAQLVQQLNNGAADPARIRDLVSEITGRQLDPSNFIALPFHTDYGAEIYFGKNAFVNQDCLFIDRGGIYVGDHVLIGPRCTIISVNHGLASDQRGVLDLRPVHLEKNCWLGANVTILPGITVGENAIVGAGAVVTKDVPANTVVVGNPARIIRKLQ